MAYCLRLRNIGLFLLAILSIVYFGQRKKINKSPKKVLLVQLSKLGDMVCFTPVLRALRENMPAAKIYIMGDSINEKVLEGNKDFDKYLVFDEKKIFRLIKEVKAEGIDVAIMRGTNFTALATALIAGVPSVIAPKVYGGVALETRTYRWLLPYVHTIIFKFRQYMPREFLRLLEPLDIYAEDTSKHLVFSNQAGEKVRELFKINNIDIKKDFLVGVSPSAGNTIKEWPGERFAKVIDHLRDKYGARVFLMAGPKEEEKASRVINNVSSRENLINLQGRLNIDELKALIANLNLFIAVDTGPIYIAEAFGVPTVDILGPMDEKEQPPQGPLNVSVYLKDRKEPMLHIMNARIYDVVEARRQVEGISAEQVVGEIDQLISKIEEKRK